jgi:purine catabolism regulator
MSGQALVMIGTAEHQAAIDRAGERILRLFDRRVSVRLNSAITIGRSGEASDLSQLHRANVQAKVAAMAARQRTKMRSCAFEELGLLGLVMVASQSDDVDSLHDNVLNRRLAELPTRERETNIATLRALVQTNFNVAETARIVHCHYNTARYRIRRLEELLGPFTTDVRLRVNIILSLQLLEFATTPPETNS